MAQPDQQITLRDIHPEDLPIFFVQNQDAEAVHMAAFTPKDPSDREAFDKRWQRIRAEPHGPFQTILWGDEVAGHMFTYLEEERTEITYWLGREYWGKGIASGAVSLFLQKYPKRPVYARAAKDNPGSLRVLEKNGFVIIGEDKGFANGRNAEVEEYVLRLD